MMKVAITIVATLAAAATAQPLSALSGVGSASGSFGSASASGSSGSAPPLSVGSASGSLPPLLASGSGSLDGACIACHTDCLGLTEPLDDAGEVGGTLEFECHLFCEEMHCSGSGSGSGHWDGQTIDFSGANDNAQPPSSSSSTTTTTA